MFLLLEPGLGYPGSRLGCRLEVADGVFRASGIVISQFVDCSWKLLYIKYKDLVFFDMQGQVIKR
jgi:hypothetical protein